MRARPAWRRDQPTLHSDVGIVVCVRIRRSAIKQSSPVSPNGTEWQPLATRHAKWWKWWKMMVIDGNGGNWWKMVETVEKN
jgi:hypothetical protein